MHNSAGLNGLTWPSLTYRETSSPTLFKPAAIVREVTNFYFSRAQSQGVTIIVNSHSETQVLGIAGELRQILSNLLANGLDACEKGATMRVDTSAASDPRDPIRTGVRITVADTGCGIQPNHIERIFEPFFTTKKDTGTGLGLWVSRELVEKHGGTLRVRSSTSDSRSGTVFSIFLPEQGIATRHLPLPAEHSQAPLPNGHSMN